MPPSTKQETGRGCAVVVVIAAVITLFAVRGSLCSSRPTAGGPSWSVRPDGGSLLPGDDCIVMSPNGDRAIVAATIEDWDRFQQLLRAQDKLGASGMLLERRPLTIEPGTRGKVIQLHGWSGVREVRLHDGTYAGRAVFVAEHNLRRSP